MRRALLGALALGVAACSIDDLPENTASAGTSGSAGSAGSTGTGGAAGTGGIAGAGAAGASGSGQHSVVVDLPQNALDPSLTGQGRVTSTDGAIDCGTKCSAIFSNGTAVLEATPEPRSALHSWSSNIACAEGDNAQTCTLALDQDAMVSAHFVTNGANLWAKQFSNDGAENAIGVALDALGNVLVTGRFDNNGNFGGTDMLATSGDVWVGKYDARGQHVASRSFGSSQDEWGLAIAASADGGVVVGGEHKGTISMPPVTIPFGGVDTVWFDGFVAKLDGALSPLWGIAFTAAANDLVTSVVTDTNDNVFVSVWHWANLVAPLPHATSSNSADITVVKLDSLGNLKWIGSFADEQNQGWPSLALAPDGNLLLAGFAASSTGVAWSNGSGCASIVSDTAIPFLVKIDQDGNCLWTRALGVSGNNGEVRVVKATSDAIYVGGSFSGQLQLDGVGGNSQALLSASGTDAFVARLGTDGSWQPSSWARRIGDSGGENQIVLGLGTDDTGDLTAFVQVAGDVDAGGGLTSSSGGVDVLIAKYGPANEHRWSHRYGTLGDEEAGSVACGPSGACVIVGSHGTIGALDFGGIAPNPQPSPSNYDVFVAKFAP